MKKNTLILLLLAAVLGIAVYFLEIRDGKPRDEATADTSKPAFDIKREDIASITVNRSGQSVTLEERDGKWLISQPLNATADQSTVDSLISSITGARIERSLPASEDDRKTFGLAEPAVTLDLKLKGGQEHKIQLGNKDFSGLSVYGIVDDASEVALLPASVLTNSDKSIDDLRDRSVLGVSQFDIASLALNNENGRIELGKDDGNWTIKGPMAVAADESEVTSLLNELTSARATEFVSDASADLSQYGLNKPVITVTAKLVDGGERVLTLGSKTDELYYAKNQARSEVLKVDSSLYDKLNVKLADLRDKQIVKLNKDDLTRIEVKNPNLTLIAEKDGEGKWLIKSPADKKDKEAQTYKVFDPLETKATEILDAAPASARAKLAKPAVEVKLTDKSGQVTEISVSSADGDNAYVSVKGKPGVYKVGKQMVEDLSFKAADISL